MHCTAGKPRWGKRLESLGFLVLDYQQQAHCVLQDAKPGQRGARAKGQLVHFRLVLQVL